MKFQKVKTEEPLPRVSERILYKGPSSLPILSTGSYLLSYLYQEGAPFVPLLGRTLSYGGYWRSRDEYTEIEAEEEGILLLDRWHKKTDGYRVYLRETGYALLLSEVHKGRGWGEVQGVLRHLKPYEAVPALGGLREILGVLSRLSREFASYTAHPELGKKAGKLAWWCRAVVKDLKKRKLV